MDKKEIIDSILALAPDKADKRILDSKTKDELLNILEEAVTAFEDERTERLATVHAERDAERLFHERRIRQAREPQRQAEAAALEKANRAVFAEAATTLGLSNAEANYAVLVQALGTLTVFDIREFISANPTALVQATPTELQEREAERIKQHNQMLLNADPITLKKLVQQEAEQRSIQAKQQEADRNLQAAIARDANYGFAQLPEMCFLLDLHSVLQHYACNMIEHIDKQKSPRRARNRQHESRVGHLAVWASVSSHQAQSWDKPVHWFFKGLERFVNTGDSLNGYQALGRAFPSFWPLPLEDGHGHDLSWVPEAHALFLFYRDLLRRFWMRDPVALKDGFNTLLLFGTLSHEQMRNIIAGPSPVPVSWALEKALAPLRGTHPDLCVPSGPAPFASFWPDWTSSNVTYVSQVDFQRAIWLLFRESWRGKVCPNCSAYFLVQKSAQLYCSLSCSNSAHQASSLRWWKEKGSRRRAARMKASTRERKHR